MRHYFAPIAAFVGLCLTSLIFPARAEIGPCKPNGDFDFICGSGIGAARAIVKTISPSKRLAFAWRLANSPPLDRPKDSDPSLENFVVRLEDGAVLVKSQGAYWDLGTKIAKAYLFVAWSPDSRLLVKVEQREDLASAELFSFAEDDTVIGPFDVAKVVKSALPGAKTNSILVFAAHPAPTISDQGLMRAAVFTRAQDAIDGPTYDVTIQVTRRPDSLDANVASIALRTGASISVIVH